ncbi:MAG: alpha/beta fold hydrolase [Acidobacteriota bacterium]
MKHVLLGLVLAAGVLCAEDVTLQTRSGDLPGTMEAPAGKGPFPVVVIHAGSGPTDRDGNSPSLPGKNNSLKMVAEALLAEGVASLRYDKRGAASGQAVAGREQDMRFDFLVDDLVGWGEQLRKDKRFSKLILLGHSEGALISCLAAGKLKAEGYISASGPGEAAGAVILSQLRAQAPPDLMNIVEGIVASLNKGEPVAETPPALASLFRASVQPYLISWFKYDPAAEIAKLKMPVLITQGTTDVQVRVEDAHLLAKAQPAAKLVLVEGMNHVLKLASGTIQQQLPAYGDPNLVLAPVFATEVVAFVKSVARQ